MLRVCVGHSNDPDSSEAIAEVLAQCQAELQGQSPQVGILMAAIGFDYDHILQTIQDTFPALPLIGTTTNGEISSVLAFQEDSLSLMLFAGDTIEIGVGLGLDAGANPEQAAQVAVAMASQSLSTIPQLCITFPDSTNVDGSAVVRGLNQALGYGVPVVGGTSADNLSFDSTRQFYGGQVWQNAIPVLLIGGNIKCSCGVVSGWQPIGKKTTVTKASGLAIQEIGDQPAIEFYRQCLGATEVFKEYVNYPLAVFAADGQEFYVRSPFTYDQNTDSLVFASKIPEGTTVQMSVASQKDVLSATAASLEKAFAQYPGSEPAAALIISCAARRALLGTQTKREYEIFQGKMPRPIPCWGFYSYGEISPFAPDRPSYFHNETFVTVLLGEN